MPDSPAPPVSIPGTGKLMARFVTDVGNIEAELYEKQTPRTVANFVALATGAVEWKKPDGTKTKDPLYKNLKFHRVIPDFMIQGGCPNGTGGGGPGYQIEAEFNDTPHVRGVLSMARAQDPDSAGSQFFICHGDARFLDRQYTAFGEVVKGDDVLEKLANVPTKSGGGAELVLLRASGPSVLGMSHR
jgi:peptidyl-prolyl cis-trans isomerase B (cyclophilin B)